MPLTFDNPEQVAPPLGAYSHAVAVPAGSGLLFVSGQVPVRRDGSTATSLAEQADQVYANLVAVLAAKGLGPTAGIKLVTYLVADDAEGAVRRARAAYFGDHRPASTLVYVRRLVEPAWQIEIEAVALGPVR